MSKAEQVRNELRRHGITMSAWARANGHSPQDVSDVLRGRSKGNFGESHAIAVKLGLKDGEIAGPDMLTVPMKLAEQAKS